MALAGTAGGRISAGVGANLIGQHAQDRNQEATVYVGNLDAQMAEEVVWELFVQTGPVVNVYLPKDRVTNHHQGYGFVEFRTEEDADYAIKILNMIKVYGKPIRVNKASQDKNTLDVGANLFIGNLDPEVDEKLLYDTFSAFGVIIATPKIMRDPDTGTSRGFGFVSYDSFEASDASIEAMNGQYLCNRAITVSYAFKKDTKGERHGGPAERAIAATKRLNQASQQRPNTLFATGPKQAPQPGPEGPQPITAPSGFAAGQFPPPPPPSSANSGPPPPPSMGNGYAPPMPPQMGAMRAPPPPPSNYAPPPPGPWNMQPPAQPQQQMQPGYGGQAATPPQNFGGPPGGYQGPPPQPWGAPQGGPPPGYGPPRQGMPPGYGGLPGMPPQGFPPQGVPPGMQGFPPGLPPPPQSYPPQPARQ